MTFAFLPFPYLNGYTLTTQLGILVALMLLSYRYNRVRIALIAMLGIYTAYKITLPLVRWGYIAFKAIAMFGFYVYFFVIGVGYAMNVAVGIWNFPELLKNFADSLDGR
ncbi:hypothetical protein C8F04DRAFT_126771 [Mycena alexandri]|uniref:Uncharacterized protein n=1 Tax=Mycena alexandri TaxID=1745969 RepID=A0AAD6SFH6_9AGAR|nr:hypothetical protein C8F04DRAFT_126771 [Mycena alexandri]